MTPEQLKQQVRQIVIWKRGTQRAPNKPLLLLYALGRLVNAEQRLIPFAEVDVDLRSLLLEFGPERKAYHPEYPFWRLQNDGIWELINIQQFPAFGGIAGNYWTNGRSFRKQLKQVKCEIIPCRNDPSEDGHGWQEIVAGTSLGRWAGELGAGSVGSD
jgi:predicted restriction endonuclease